MAIKFWKYQGTGNDFVMIDGRHDDFKELSSEKIEYLCHRRFGIGADGLIILENSDTADFVMRYYNSDGHISSMCGNGGRCITRFAHDLGIVKAHYHFIAIDGPHESYIEGNQVHLKMSDVKQVEDLGNANYFVDTGSPHYVSMGRYEAEKEIVTKARQIRYSEPYKDEGVNVNFVKKEGNALVMRTYERGVEDETLSCGTGVTAAVLAADRMEAGEETTRYIKTKGGELSLSFKRSGEGYTDIWLVGPVKQVYQGYIEL